PEMVRRATHSRRLLGPSSDCAGVWRPDRSRPTGARPANANPPRWHRLVCQPASTTVGVSLPLAPRLRRTAERAARHRPQRSGRDHGGAASAACDLRRAVPSRVVPQPRWPSLARELSPGGRMSHHVIELTSVQKSYEHRAVLHDIHLAVPKGQLLGLVGPNGAGKSTLLRLLVGLVQRSAGKVQVAGHDPALDSLAIRRRCCYLPGETGVYQQMTGAGFLKFALGFYPEQSLDLKERLLTEFALPLNKRVRSYSAGMKQKLALVAALVPDVDLYLLDEPDRALDASVR